MWGDGSSTYSLAEVEPSVRNKLPFIALIGIYIPLSYLFRTSIVSYIGTNTIHRC